MLVAITGISGFIGGQVALYLHSLGIEILGVDLRPCSPEIQATCVRFVQDDYGGIHAHKAMMDMRPEAILHLAASSLVAPSIAQPEQYIHNNVFRLWQMTQFWRQVLPRTRIIFSSSSSVYGEPRSVPITEDHGFNPMSPYGQTKLTGEFILHSVARAYGLEVVSFRYFNVCGADPEARHGQEPGATHIIARVLESLRDGTEFRLNGDDYDTADGTCVRDHVHVQDVARLHALALYPALQPGAYNVGIQHGASNREIMELAQEITGRQLKYTVGPRRAGDPGQLLADTTKIRSQGWEPQYSLRDMIQHAWAWYNR
jgi:UDP-glucose-4-epimerase GalE